MVVHDDKSFLYAEERRLFYVALTRTKNRVFILYPTYKPSVFVREIAKDYTDITVRGQITDKKTKKEDIPELGIYNHYYKLNYDHNYNHNYDHNYNHNYNHNRHYNYSHYHNYDHNHYHYHNHHYNYNHKHNYKHNYKEGGYP